MNYSHMTAPCGLPCFECYFYLAKDRPELRELVSRELGIQPADVTCAGCRDEGGKCAHLPMPCRVYPCAEGKGLRFCSDGADFPCDYLHPYRDNAIMWHNTKVFHLCLIKKLGLEEWARNKAGSVCQTYSFGKWRL